MSDTALIDATMNDAVRLHEAGDLQAAFAGYQAVLRENPRHFGALYSSGAVCMNAGALDQALVFFEGALRINPNYVDAWYNRGGALFRLGRREEALPSFNNAIALKPDYVEALTNRAVILLETNQPEAALRDCNAALAINPDFLNALINRGNAYNALNRFAESAADYEAALKLSPDYAFLKGMLAHARIQMCDWSHYAEDTKAIQDGVAAGKPVVIPLAGIRLPSTPKSQTETAKLWTEWFHPPASPLWTGQRYDHKRLRIGYLSGDYGDSAVGNQIADMLEAHDRRRVETIGIAFGPDDGTQARKRLEEAVEKFADISDKSDADAGAFIRALEIDILVDLMGHTRGARTNILALKAAPVQVNYLGFPGSMGASYMDYIVADACVIPPEHEGFYTEAVVRLPNCFMPASRAKTLEAPPSREDEGLPQTGFVFASFNATYKFSPEIFDVWMRLLKAVPGSVLWLGNAGDAARDNLKHEAGKHGIAAERIVFARFAPRETHIARHALADLMLDTQPYNGHSTMSDALSGLVPVVASMGTTFAGRVAASYLHAAGLSDLVANDVKEYEAKALALATDEKLRASVREWLRAAREHSPAFNPAASARALEDAYVQMHARASMSKKPESFSVG